jgi:hypothetical protein
MKSAPYFFAFGLLFSARLAAATISPHPGFQWTPVAPFAEYEISITAGDGSVVAKDKIAQVARYVSATALAPGSYELRVESAEHSVVRQTFEVVPAEDEIVIRAGADLDAVHAALARAREQPFTRIVFEKGTYRFDPGNGGTFLEIAGTSNLIVDGGGAKFILGSIARVARIRDSQHVTLANFTVDYDVPLHTSARVEAVGPDGTLELSLMPGCAAPESSARFMEEQRGLFYDGTIPRMAEQVPLLVHMDGPWEKTGESRYRLRAKNPPDVRRVQPGMIYICAPRYEAQGFEIYACEDITLADITTFYLPGIGVSSVFAEDLKLIRLRMLRREDRLLAVQNGGTNLHNARVGPWVEQCRFENTGDDCNHINALVFSPILQPDSRSFEISHRLPGIHGRMDDLGIKPGDQLAFFDRPTGHLLLVAAAVSAELSPAGTTLVTVDADLPDLAAGQWKGFPPLDRTQIYNLSATAGNFVFRSNVFSRGRRTGLLAKGGPGLVERNTFEELGGGGVEIFNAPFEGLHGHDILIRNNEFRHGGIVHKNSGAAPALWLKIFDGKNPQPLHRNIHFVGNRISDYPSLAIDAQDTSGLTIADNIFAAPSARTGLRDEDIAAIRLRNVHGAGLRGNQFLDDRYARPLDMKGCTDVEQVPSAD